VWLQGRGPRVSVAIQGPRPVFVWPIYRLLRYQSYPTARRYLSARFHFLARLYLEKKREKTFGADNPHWVLLNPITYSIPYWLVKENV
jgi:hypothetical protein